MTAQPFVPTTRVVRRFFHEIVLHDNQQVLFVHRNLGARIISIKLQHHFSLETPGNMPACDSPCLYCTPHSPVVSHAMQLVIHDECLDSECPTA